ncbi:hypothetical protein [Candidatus Symbiopectobacterium sp. NZEC135]|uniref:hypothetical protein n=1 Tax=Candidatus Symbiopectobacterium sp. NZEC135 TaxID=2820471 RepID=UPI002226EBDF|nr:hypothetical protein [Candidatus Symbiopectobacterium sp. NZEC135]MCW2479600.1 hypothetical protein [Candidatus Symbiopectobacterium sp. NZEC135]
MQGISTTSSSFDKMCDNHIEKPKEPDNNINDFREEPLPITSLHEEITSHLQKGYDKVVGDTINLNDRNNTIKGIVESRSNVGLVAMPADSGNVETAVPIFSGEKNVRELDNKIIRKRNVSSSMDNVGKKRIIDFLQQNGLGGDYLSDPFIEKETLISGLAKYLYYEDVSNEALVEKKQNVASLILGNSNLYGGVKGETISPKMAQSVIKEWLFNQVIACSIGKYIADKMVLSENPSKLTVSDLRRFFNLSELVNDGKINVNHLDVEQKIYFFIMWNDCLENEIPLFKSQDYSVLNISLMSQDFADLYTGYKYVNSVEKLSDVSSDEIIAIGRALWNMAFSEGFSIDDVDFLFLPSVITMADKSTNQLDAEESSFSVKMEALDKYIEYQRSVIVSQNDFIIKFNQLNTLLSTWVSKKELADNIINDCMTTEFSKTGTLSPVKKSRIELELIKEGYMNGFLKPCDESPDLDEEYKILVKNLSEKFKSVNNFLIHDALSSIGKSELDFISSAGAKINSIKFTMRSSTPLITNPGATYPNIENYKVEIKDADLFSVTVGNKERVYALKKETDSLVSPYKIIRVDHDLQRYINAGLLNRDFRKGYEIKNGKLIDDIEYEYFFKKPTPSVELKGQERGVVKYLNDKHSDQFYEQVFEMGNDKSNLQQVISFIKTIIPVYTCVEGIVNNDDLDKYIGSCVADALTLLPAVGFAASLGGKFGIGLARGARLAIKPLMKGSFSGAGATLSRSIHVPTMSEYLRLGRISLQTVDPGFELLANSGTFLTKKIMPYLKLETNGINVLKKIAVFDDLRKTSHVVSEEIIMARFPDSGIEVPVTKINNGVNKDLYVMTDPETGDKFGRRYTLSENKILEEDTVRYMDLSVPGVQKYNQNVVGITSTNSSGSEFINVVDVSDVPSGVASYGDVSDIANISDISDISDFHINQGMGIENIKEFLPPNGYAPLDLSPGGKWLLAVEGGNVTRSKGLSEAILRSTIVSKYNGNYDNYLCKYNVALNDVPEEYEFLRENLDFYKQHVEEAKNMINSLKEKLIPFSEVSSATNLNFREETVAIKRYLHDALMLDSIEDLTLRIKIENEAIKRFHFYVKKVSEYFDKNIENIIFATSSKRGRPYVPDLTINNTMALTVPGDEAKRVVLLLDNIHAAREHLPGVYTVLYHDISHVDGSYDIKSIGMSADIKKPSYAMEEFNNAVRDGNIKNIKNIHKLYQHKYARDDISEAQFKELLKQDPMLRVNVFMDNADSLAILMSNLGRGAHLNRNAAERVRREATLPQFELTFPLYKLSIEVMRITEKQPFEITP